MELVLVKERRRLDQWASRYEWYLDLGNRKEELTKQLFERVPELSVR